MLRGLYAAWFLLSLGMLYLTAQTPFSRTDETPCPCPYDVAGDGSRCGGGSAYCQKGGMEPVCYLPGVQGITRLHCR